MPKKKGKRKNRVSDESASKEPVGLVKRELSEQEKSRMAAYQQKAGRKPVKFKSMKADGRNLTITLRDPDDPLVPAKMSEAFGTADHGLQTHLLDQVMQTFKGTMSADGADFGKLVTAANNAMAILSGMQPRDEIEAMLAIQMVGVHNLAMEAMNRAALDGQTFEGKKVNVDYTAKMLKAFAMQLEILRKYRSGGPQKMVFERVNVGDGGQAIVGTVRIDKSERPD